MKGADSVTRGSASLIELHGSRGRYNFPFYSLVVLRDLAAGCIR